LASKPSTYVHKQTRKKLDGQKTSKQIVSYQGDNGTTDPKKMEAIEKVIEKNQPDEGAASGKRA
jgi:hypothetical protein